jgi:disulfide oxidoreductase YuzD
MKNIVNFTKKEVSELLTLALNTKGVNGKVNVDYVNIHELINGTNENEVVIKVKVEDESERNTTSKTKE